MSASRMEKRHPATPAGKLLTTRDDVVAFSTFLSTHPDFCMAVVKTVETLRHNEKLVAEYNRREAWPAWRKWLHKRRMDLQTITRSK